MSEKSPPRSARTLGLQPMRIQLLEELLQSLFPPGLRRDGLGGFLEVGVVIESFGAQPLVFLDVSRGGPGLVLEATTFLGLQGFHVPPQRASLDRSRSTRNCRVIRS